MRLRFVLLTILATSSVYARSMTSASCLVGQKSQTVNGSSSASCSLDLILNGTYYGTALGSATIAFSPGNISVEGNGGFSLANNSVPYPIQVSGGGQASYQQTFDTAGPIRPGFISVIANAFGGTSFAQIVQNGNTLTGSIPMGSFELGEPFEVELGANGGGGGTLPCIPGACDLAGDSGATIEGLTLFEADGTTAVSYFPIATPEPSSWEFVLASFALYAGRALVIRARVRVL